jgi:hypothetical protein
MSRFHRSDEWFDTQVKDEVLMMHGDSGRFISLNESAAAIWAALESPRDIDELVRELLKIFEVEEDVVRADIVECLTELEKEGAVLAEDG